MKTKKKATEFDIEVGKRIKALRETSGVSQSELAKVTGSSYQQLSKSERGIDKVSFSTACQIAAYFKVSIDDLSPLNKQPERMVGLVTKQTRELVNLRKKFNKIKRIIG